MIPDSLSVLRARPAKRIIGLISGTSADGVAAALVNVTETHPHPDAADRTRDVGLSG